MSLLNVTGRLSVSGIRAVGKTVAVFHIVSSSFAICEITDFLAKFERVS